MEKITAAGILFKARSTGRVLLGKRAARDDDDVEYWACFGGKVEGSETPREAAIREVFEETGYGEANMDALRLRYRSDQDSEGVRVVYYCFNREVADEFEVEDLDEEEHTDFGWFSLNDLPSPLLPAFEENV